MIIQSYIEKANNGCYLNFVVMKKPPAQLSPEALEMIAARFRALSEPTRLKLIIALENDERNVSGLVQATGLTQANASRHLQTLTEVGILGRRKAGLNVYYYIADPTIFKLCELVCKTVQDRLTTQANAFAGGS